MTLPIVRVKPVSGFFLLLDLEISLSSTKRYKYSYNYFVLCICNFPSDFLEINIDNFASSSYWNTTWHQQGEECQGIYDIDLNYSKVRPNIW